MTCQWIYFTKVSPLGGIKFFQQTYEDSGMKQAFWTWSYSVVEWTSPTIPSIWRRSSWPALSWDASEWHILARCVPKRSSARSLDGCVVSPDREPSAAFPLVLTSWRTSVSSPNWCDSDGRGCPSAGYPFMFIVSLSRGMATKRARRVAKIPIGRGYLPTIHRWHSSPRWTWSSIAGCARAASMTQGRWTWLSDIYYDVVSTKRIRLMRLDSGFYNHKIIHDQE